MLEKKKRDSRKISRIKQAIYVAKEMKLFETLRLTYYILICFAQFSMLENVNNDSRTISGIRISIYVVLVVNLWNLSFELLHDNLFASVYSAWNLQLWFTKDLPNKKNNLRFHIDKIYQTFHLHCYMLICLIHFSILENVDSSSQKISRKRKSIYPVIWIKLMKLSICIVACYLVPFSLVCLKKWTIIHEKAGK